MWGNGHILSHWAEGLSADWEQIRSWAQSTRTKDRMAKILVLLSTAALLTVILVSLNRAVENYSIAGISPFLSYANWHLSIPGY